MLEERLLRFAAPKIYTQLIDIFSAYQIQLHDVHATFETSENGFDVILRFSADYSQVVTQHFRPEQAIYPDGEVTRFLETAAEQCKSTLISSDYNLLF